jgi:hypothetical protein
MIQKKTDEIRNCHNILNSAAKFLLSVIKIMDVYRPKPLITSYIQRYVYEAQPTNLILRNNQLHEKEPFLRSE